MSALLQAIAKQTKVTFSQSITDISFSDSLAELLESVKKIQVADLYFNADTVRTDNGENSTKRSAPITCVDIEDNDIFSMGIFLLQNESRIPLHDHPDMHGILKVVLGTVKITSYTPLLNIPDETKVPQDIRVKSSELKSLIPVELYMSAIVTNKDEPCVLRPREGNYHEISAVGGTAAIFDILAPPYDLDVGRNCNYYSVFETKDSDAKCKIWLAPRNEPPEFWCDATPYTGPKISL